MALAVTLGASFLLGGCNLSNAEASPWPKVRSAIKQDVKIETDIDLLMAQMSLEQKVGQMIRKEKLVDQMIGRIKQLFEKTEKDVGD